MTISDIDWHPSDKKLREFAWIWLAGFGLVGLIVAWRTGAWTGRSGWEWPLGIWTAAVLVGLPGTVRPRSVAVVYRVWMALAFPIGWLVSRLVLAFTYFVLFTPLALWFRLTGRDALQRAWKSDQESYWIPLGKAPDPKQYYRQF